MIVQLTFMTLMRLAIVPTLTQTTGQPAIRKTCQVTIGRVYHNRREKIRSLTYRKGDPFAFCDNIWENLEMAKS